MSCPRQAFGCTLTVGLGDSGVGEDGECLFDRLAYELAVVHVQDPVRGWIRAHELQVAVFAEFVEVCSKRAVLHEGGETFLGLLECSRCRTRLSDVEGEYEHARVVFVGFGHHAPADEDFHGCAVRAIRGGPEGRFLFSGGNIEDRAFCGSEHPRT